MFRTVALAVGLLVSAGASQSWAWGCDGHQAVAIVAERLLGVATLAKIGAVLAASPVDPALRRFCNALPSNVLADVASWADDIRDAEPSTYGWHFINYPRAIGGRTHNHAKYCPAGDCVIDAIVSQYRALRTSQDPAVKARALRFIVHFVGDLHQPLHTTTNGDRGGNCLPVTDAGEPPMEDDRHNWRPNLHGVWDVQLVRRLMTARDLADSSALAAAVMTGGAVTPREPTTARVKEWARGANALARNVVYGRLPVSVPMEPASAIVLASCDDNRHVGRRMAALNEYVTDAYQQDSGPVIVSQLRLAGERLASTLKSAFP
jgi:hypothetical protein